MNSEIIYQLYYAGLILTLLTKAIFRFRIGAGLKDLFKQDDLYKDRDGQLQAIEKTFQDAKSEITQHYSKAGVYPVASFPVYPDMKVQKDRLTSI